MAAAKIEKMTGERIDYEEKSVILDSNPLYIQENSEQPLGLITPGNLAKFIAYLVLEDNRYITGALLPVSAGAVM